jgi:hypothetical protein
VVLECRVIIVFSIADGLAFARGSVRAHGVQCTGVMRLERMGVDGCDVGGEGGVAIGDKGNSD